jgi:hypothetical protein
VLSGQEYFPILNNDGSNEYQFICDKNNIVKYGYSNTLLRGKYNIYPTFPSDIIYILNNKSLALLNLQCKNIVAIISELVLKGVIFEVIWEN